MYEQSRQIQRGTHEQKVQLGREIAAARVRLGWGQAELAIKVRRSQEWVSRVERGALVLSAFEYARISSVLRIPPAVIEGLAWPEGDPEAELDGG